MEQHQRAFRPESFHPSEEVQNEENKEAVIIPFPLKASETAAAEAKWGKYAQPMANVAGITLSPKVIQRYAMLRDKKPDPDNPSFVDQSDQKILAEALRIEGETDSLNAFTKALPHIFN